MTDQELGERIIAYTSTLYRVSYGLLRIPADREDAVQSAIEKAWRKASRLQEDERFKAWLVRILINECYSLLRKKVRETPTDVLPEQTAQEEDGLALREAVLALPEILRIPIVLHYMEGFSIREISMALGCPQGTVLSRMNRARKQLKDLLTEEQAI